MNYIKTVSIIFIFFFSFTYGLGVGLYKWFPYENLRNIKNTYIDREPELLTIEDLKLSTSTERSGYWSVVNNSQNEINDPIILNNFKYEWIRVDDPDISKVSAARLNGKNVHYINHNDQYILSKLNLQAENLIHNAGIKAVFEFKGQTLVYVAYVDNGCATAKLVSLENDETLLQLECITQMKGDFTLLSSGGAVLILSDNEFLLSTGTPTTDHVSHPTNQLAQDDNSHWGKILKFTFNAGLPKVTIFSKGHRNPQGIAKVNGEIFAVEHGPRGGDEINLITEGANFGWPLHSFGSEYDLAQINKDDKNIKNHGLPIYSFMPSVGISSVAQCPNNYLTYYAPFRCLTVASMRAGAIFFVVFDGSKVLFTERLDIGSRLRKIFVVDNQITAITDFEGVIVGELSELTEKYTP